MSRYSKVDRRIHSDAKFRELSNPEPCAKYLFFYLLTTPKLTSIPGLISAGEAEIAEALKWPMKGFREGFRELLAKGMAKADWNARLVWLPNATKYNQPENPNVVRSWRTHWDEMPECDLKSEAWQSLKELTERLGKGFAEAFRQCCPKGSPNGIRNPMPNQEQEQEQEPKQKEKTLPTLANGRAGFVDFFNAYPRKVGKEKARKAWDKIRPSQELQMQITAALEIQKKSTDWVKNSGEFIPHPTSWLNGKRWEDEVGTNVTANGKHDPATPTIGGQSADWLKGAI